MTFPFLYTSLFMVSESFQAYMSNDNYQQGQNLQISASEIEGKVHGFLKPLPLLITLTDERKRIIKLIEDELVFEKGHKWMDFEYLTDKHAENLCLEVWNKVDLGKISTGCVLPTCQSKKLPITYEPLGYKYGVFFSFVPYVPSDYGIKADILRCNCNYLRKGSKGKITAVDRSKKYFFLLKYASQEFCILSEPRQPRGPNRKLRIIDVITFEMPTPTQHSPPSPIKQVFCDEANNVES